MKIEIAKKCGFCFGVTRAIKIAQKTPNSFTIGPLIHNFRELERLKIEHNVRYINDINDINNANDITAIIRTHGILKEDLEYLNKFNFNIINATCPYVSNLQKICEDMSNKNYTIIIFGDRNHPEVKGVRSYAKNKTYVVLKSEELENIKLSNKVAVMSQTTRKFSEFIKIVEFLTKNCKEVRVFNTICNATFDNQEASKELAKKSDIMIIIGDKNSSNTKQLFNISSEFCPSSYLVEHEDEIQKEWFEDKNLCGITAGASTPKWIIDKIVEKINKIKEK